MHMLQELLASEQDDEDVVWVKYLKIGAIIKRTLWRQNDESYRVNGRGALGGWLWMSKTYHRKFIPRAEKPTIGEKIEVCFLLWKKFFFCNKEARNQADLL